MEADCDLELPLRDAYDAYAEPLSDIRGVEMTLQPDNGKLVRRVFEGDVNDSWCSTCGRATPHVFGVWKLNLLTCLICEREASEIVNEKHKHLIPECPPEEYLTDLNSKNMLSKKGD